MNKLSNDELIEMAIDLQLTFGGDYREYLASLIQTRLRRTNEIMLEDFTDE